ncbi:MAG: hypothetical protein R2753_05320 [Chitinophagales bacterium]
MKKISKLVKLLIVFLTTIQLSSCAQPNNTRVIDVSFYLADDMQPGYTICDSRFDTDSILFADCLSATEPASMVTNRAKQIKFQFQLDNHLVLILYKGAQTMTIHFEGKYNFLGQPKELDLGEIYFKEGMFLVNNATMHFIKESDDEDWRNYKLNILDSLHYQYAIKNNKTNTYIVSYIYTKDFQLRKEVTYFPNGNINIENYYDSDFKKVFSKSHYENFSTVITKTYSTCNEYIVMDSFGIVSNRVIHDRIPPADDCRIAKSYQQKNQIGKHYTDIQNTLPISIYQSFSVAHVLYDEFITSPVIETTPYAIQISNVGYFPQDTIDINKFKAYQEEVVLKVAFSSGADKIGEPIINKRIEGKEMVYDIFIIESKASSEMAWPRAVLIPLKIGANEVYKINFPLTGNPDQITSEEYDFSPRWILLGLDDPKRNKQDAPIVIYGSNTTVD